MNRKEVFTQLVEVGIMPAVRAGVKELALFAALSLGFFVGKRKFGSFSLGTSAGVLLAGVLILIVPALLNYIVAIYLIVAGVIGLNEIHHFLN